MPRWKSPSVARAAKLAAIVEQGRRWAETFDLVQWGGTREPPKGPLIDILTSADFRRLLAQPASSPAREQLEHVRSFLMRRDATLIEGKDWPPLDSGDLRPKPVWASLRSLFHPIRDEAWAAQSMAIRLAWTCLAVMDDCRPLGPNFPIPDPSRGELSARFRAGDEWATKLLVFHALKGIPGWEHNPRTTPSERAEYRASMLEHWNRVARLEATADWSRPGGYTLEDIARLAGVTVHSQKYRLRRALLALGVIERAKGSQPSRVGHSAQPRYVLGRVRLNMRVVQDSRVRTLRAEVREVRDLAAGVVRLLRGGGESTWAVVRAATQPSPGIILSDTTSKGPARSSAKVAFLKEYSRLLRDVLAEGWQQATSAEVRGGAEALSSLVEERVRRLRHMAKKTQEEGAWEPEAGDIASCLVLPFANFVPRVSVWRYMEEAGARAYFERYPTLFGEFKPSVLIRSLSERNRLTLEAEEAVQVHTDSNGAILAPDSGRREGA